MDYYIPSKSFIGVSLVFLFSLLVIGAGVSATRTDGDVAILECSEDNVEEKCCCYIEQHTYLFSEEHYVESFDVEFTTGSFDGCISTVIFEVTDDRGKSWERINDTPGRGKERLEESFDVGYAIDGIRVSEDAGGFRDSQECYIDHSKVSVQGPSEIDTLSAEEAEPGSGTRLLVISSIVPGIVLFTGLLLFFEGGSKTTSSTGYSRLGIKFCGGFFGFETLVNIISLFLLLWFGTQFSYGFTVPMFAFGMIFSAVMILIATGISLFIVVELFSLNNTARRLALFFSFIRLVGSIAHVWQSEFFSGLMAVLHGTIFLYLLIPARPAFTRSGSASYSY